MMNAIKIVLFGILLLLLPDVLNAQSAGKSPIFTFNNGIGIVAPDSLFSLNFRFRTQLRTAYTTVDNTDLSAAEIEARVRRLRLLFRGFVLNPKFNYYFQLSFSRADMDWFDNDNSVINSSPNIVRDAIVTYQVNENLSVLFGQTKLPGNRQRVVSSGELQFTDRSIANAVFNIDRDFGAQFIYDNKIANLTYILRGAITSGEGRNSTASDAGLAYTGRVEVLPFGDFNNRGDYFEGDLEREKTLKASIAAGYHYNESAVRTAGTLGRDLYDNRNLSSFIADFLLKYNGFSFSAEYLNRNTDNPITVNLAGDERRVYTGDGKMAQLSYLFKNNIEVSTRYAIVTPNSKIEQQELQREELGVGITKYLRRHRIKLQGQVFYQQGTDIYVDVIKTKAWNAMFQIELGI